MILLSDPEILCLPVVECGEPLLDLRLVQALRLDPRLSGQDECAALLRVGLVDRLLAAQSLLPAEYRLLVIEGQRSMAMQARLFARQIDRLRLTHPDADEAWLNRQASRYIAPPEVAPHVAGAAVDVTLCTADGVELWLGTEVGDTSTTACHANSLDISGPVRESRARLARALEAVGLVNYPTEWWHWSYGDRYWAHVTGASAARYGPL